VFEAMLKTLLLVVFGAAVGAMVAFWSQPDPAVVAESSSAAAEARLEGNGIERARLAALERALTAEAKERAELETRVGELAIELAALRSEEPQAATERAPAPDVVEEPQRPRRAFGPRADAPRQVERLIAGGFSPDRAEWIDRRTQELRMQALQAQYDAQRDGRPFEPGTAGGERALRAELGEADYERYLQAVGRPTSVGVQGLLASSPAERAGLATGDEIVSYDGQRVFDLRELNALTLAGTAGESVVVEVRREGQTLQLVMPRGPIGIFGGGFRGPPGR
jgi:membrane-associated protease RseP (regulator of RpoE activity)